jgi:predicted HAD superfamily Cof-like phosphohydrolase
MLTRQDIEDMGYEYYNPDYKTKVKLFNFTPMDMVKEFAEVMGQKPNAELYEKLVIEEFEEWFEIRDCIQCDELEDDTEYELKELSDLVYVIFGYANAKGWNLMEAIRRVHANNMGRCMQPDGSVKRREDGKILKNKDYPAVDLSDLV